MNIEIKRGIISLRVKEVKLRHCGDYWDFVLEIDELCGEYKPYRYFNTPHQALAEVKKVQVKLKF